MRTSELKGGGIVTISSFPCACGCCAPGYTDTCFPFYVVMLADAMRSTDISHYTFSCHVTSDVSASHATSSLTRTFPVSVSRDSYCTCMCHGDPPRLFFVTLTFSCLCFLLISGYVDSSFSQFSLRPYVTQTTRLSTFSPIRLYFCLVLLRFLRLFVLVSY